MGLGDIATCLPGTPTEHNYSHAAVTVMQQTKTAASLKPWLFAFLFKYMLLFKQNSIAPVSVIGSYE